MKWPCSSDWLVQQGCDILLLIPVGGTQNHYAILSENQTRYRVIRTDLKSIPVHLTELFKLLFYLNGQSIQVIKHDVIGLRE